MQAQRIIFLKEALKADPEDPFNYYALALEYINDKPAETNFYFDTLLTKFGEYLPTYYKAANFYFEREEIEKAKETFVAGIELAEKQGNAKAFKELKGSYQQFLDEIED
jgi:tetratricopeptide (TPR) repeat protein